MLRVQETIYLYIESIVWARIMRNTSERWVQIRNVRLDFFNKPADAAYTEWSELPYPMATENLNHEIELVVTIGRNGTNLLESEALDYVFGYAVGLDLIRRDLQGEANKKCRPWPARLHVLLCTSWTMLDTQSRLKLHCLSTEMSVSRGN